MMMKHTIAYGGASSTMATAGQMLAAQTGLRYTGRNTKWPAYRMKRWSIMTTIRDVAQLAGVARTTVSHALSGRRPVSAATRERVLAAARALNYQPNAMAHSLAVRRTHTVGLALPLNCPLTGGRYLEFIVTITEQLNQHGYKLLCLISRDVEASDLVSLAGGGHVDGILLLEVLLDDARVPALRHAGVPFVAIGRPRHVDEVVHVDADAVGAAETAVRYLFELGHRRIAFLGEAQVKGYHHRALQGFEAAHADLGVPLQRSQVLFYDASLGLGTALQPLLDPASPITALVSALDIQAVEVPPCLRGTRAACT